MKKADLDQLVKQGFDEASIVRVLDITHVEFRKRVKLPSKILPASVRKEIENLHPEKSIKALAKLYRTNQDQINLILAKDFTDIVKLYYEGVDLAEHYQVHGRIILQKLKEAGLFVEPTGPSRVRLKGQRVEDVAIQMIHDGIDPRLELGVSEASYLKYLSLSGKLAKNRDWPVILAAIHAGETVSGAARLYDVPISTIYAKLKES